MAKEDNISINQFVATALAIYSTAFAKERTAGRGTGPVVYVTSQGLYYNSIVVAEPLPANGRFQQLISGENDLQTEFGPGIFLDNYPDNILI